MTRWDVGLWAWNRSWNDPRGALHWPLMTVPIRRLWRIGRGGRVSEWFHQSAPTINKALKQRQIHCTLRPNQDKSTKRCLLFTRVPLSWGSSHECDYTAQFCVPMFRMHESAVKDKNRSRRCYLVSVGLDTRISGAKAYGYQALYFIYVFHICSAQCFRISHHFESVASIETRPLISVEQKSCNCDQFHKFAVCSRVTMMQSP